MNDVKKVFSKASVIDIENPGTLEALFTPHQKYSITSLKIRGAINGNDISFLREMMHTEPSGGVLEALDLSEAYIVKGGKYETNESKQPVVRYTIDNVIGDYMFEGCDVLKYFMMPEMTVKIGERAFLNCHQLSYFEFAKTVKSIGSFIFNREFTVLP